jgi:hypothetical protein
MVSRLGKTFNRNSVTALGECIREHPTLKSMSMVWVHVISSTGMADASKYSSSVRFKQCMAIT